MSKILVTGSSGFVGQALCKALASNTENELVLHSRSLAGVQSGHKTFSAAITPNTDWSETLSGVDVVIHTAARVHMMVDLAEDPLAEFKFINTLSTLELARQAARAGVKRFIFLSSIKVMGDEPRCLNQAYSIDDYPKPNDPYGISKFEAEQGLYEIAHQTGLEVVIIRPPLVYGPGVKANFRQLIKLLSRQLPLPLGSVNNKRSLVALPNLIDLIICCVDHPAAANKTFLVSDNEDLSSPELMRAIAKALEKKAILLPVPIVFLNFFGKLFGKSSEVDRLCGSLQVDISHTLNTLSWRPPVTVTQGIQQTVAAFLAEGKN